MSFRENRVDIAFDNGRDMFEADAKKILGGLNLGKLREQMGREISYITDFIDELLLNRYLFPQ